MPYPAVDAFAQQVSGNSRAVPIVCRRRIEPNGEPVTCEKDLAGGRLVTCLVKVVGYLAYVLDQLRDDLERLIFLLVGNDGEALFSP